MKIAYQWTLARPNGSFTIRIEQAQQNEPIDEKTVYSAQRWAGALRVDDPRPVADLKSGLYTGEGPRARNEAASGEYKRQAA